MKFPGSGLYLITQTENRSTAEVITIVEQALQAGANVLQYRDKPAKQVKILGAALRQLCTDYQIPLIINDNVDLALELGADGVHLGKDDASLADARLRLGQDAIIGVSCYNSLDSAIAMQTQGADYIAFGRFFPSTSKPLAAPAQLATLTQAKALITIPIVAIGGILPTNAQPLLAAGADLLAVIGGVFDADNPGQMVKAYNKLFNQ